MSIGGSSPLTRGKRSASRRRPLLLRLIPAHAGKTPWGVCVSVRVGAHPRSRGENASHRSCRLSAFGSSPLTRGKLVRSLDRNPDHGLIPAHAGKTSRGLPSSSRAAAHPRSRGENHGHVSRPRGELGSSPLTRGKPVIEIITSGAARLIPAHAGKTAAGRQDTRRSRAHPRSRGENFASVVPIVLAGGSSPLTRGKLGVERGDRFACRLIPAHAGKTPGSSKARQSSRAHPRSRGENRGNVTDAS